MPLEYYQTNLDSTFALVRAMQRHGCFRLVFSSSATVYGESATPPFTEDLPTSATNPYGWTKVMIEQVLRDVARTDDRWRIALLRYFNPVGAHAVGHHRRGPVRDPQQPHAVHRPGGGRASSRSSASSVTTTTPPTAPRCATTSTSRTSPSGHLAALTRLGSTDERVSTWNLGTGHGTSVLEVLRAFERACGHDLPHEVVGRRAGDIAASYADPSRAERELGWKATRTIEDMCADQWHWQRGNPLGYPD